MIDNYEPKPKSVSSDVTLCEGINIKFRLSEFIDSQYDHDLERYVKKDTDTYDISIDMSDCDQSKIHGDIDIVFPNGDTISLWSNNAGLSYSMKFSNGSEVYQEIYPPKG